MCLSINNTEIRKMALLLLDDNNGIDIEAYETLSEILAETCNGDILIAVEVSENSVFINEDFAEEELAKIAKIEELETEAVVEAEKEERDEEDE